MQRDERDLLPSISQEIYTGKRGERGWREDEGKGAGTGGGGGGGVFALRTLKNGQCQSEIKKMWKEREREKWVNIRVDDRVKNEEGEENPV